jgi:hypothetical protein
MGEHKTKFTPTEALRVVDGLHRRRLYEMMKNGEISYEMEGPEGKTRRIIDGSELARVFRNAFKPMGTQGTETRKKLKHSETHGEHAENNSLQTEIQVLQERLKAKDEMLSQKNEMIHELRRDRDTWRTQAQTLLLTGGGEGAAKGGFWAWLMGK